MRSECDSRSEGGSTGSDVVSAIANEPAHNSSQHVSVPIKEGRAPAELANFAVGAARGPGPAPVSLWPDRPVTVSSSRGAQRLEDTLIESAFYCRSPWALEVSWGSHSGQQW